MRLIALRIPVIVMVLAAIAIPVELRPPGQVSIEHAFDPYDFVENVAGFVPVGIVLAGLGPLWAIAAATLMSALAETGQFVMMHRDPSPMDVAANVLGAVLGTAASARWNIRSPGFIIGRGAARVAAVSALALVLGAWAHSGVPISARGATAPGTLEAHWKLDESSGRIALDSSGHGLHGKFNREPKRVPGATGGAASFAGAKDYVDIGSSTGLRLAGSMTISSWIFSTSFPADDATIVSNYNRSGYQLDTTVDRGPRTIGFRLADACGQLVTRYGATPLAINTWHHAAGVYDAEARTMDVYLNGELDNGFLFGTVPGAQLASRKHLYLGRSHPDGYDFVGSIDDVRIYSLTLSKAEIVADMRGRAIDGHGAARRVPMRPPGSAPACAALSEVEEARMPAAAAAFGVLVAVACVGLWPSSGPLLSLIVSFAAGFLFLPAMASTPLPYPWVMPLASLLGGASVAVSLRGKDGPRA